MAAHTYTRTEDRRLAHLVAQETPWEQIARTLNRSVSSVWGRATRLGLHQPACTHQRLSPQQRSDIIRRYQDGETLEEIARAHQRSVGAVSAVISRLGLANRRPDNGPVRRHPDGTRECRQCRQWLVETAYASANAGTCRECRNAQRRTSAPRAPAPATTPRRRTRDDRGVIPAAALAGAMTRLEQRYDTDTIAREELDLSEAQWRRLREAEGQVSVDVADRILTAADMPELLAELVA